MCCLEAPDRNNYWYWQKKGGQHCSCNTLISVPIWNHRYVDAEKSGLPCSWTECDCDYLIFPSPLLILLQGIKEIHSFSLTLNSYSTGIFHICNCRSRKQSLDSLSLCLWIHLIFKMWSWQKFWRPCNRR